MRILLLQESDWIKRGPHQQHHLIERMLRKGHDVRVIDFEIDWRKNGSPLQKPSRRLYQSIGGKSSNDVSVVLVRPTLIRVPLLDYFSEALGHATEIEVQLTNFRPDIVIGLGIVNAYIGCKLAKREGIPFVYYLIDSLDTLVPIRNLRGFAKKLVSQTLRQANHVIVINKELRRYTMELGADPAKLSIIGAGVDLARINPSVNGEEVRASLGIDKSDFVMFFMGWLYNFSGLKEVAKSLASFPGNNRLRLLILGQGELSSDLELLRNQMLGSKLILVPWKPYNEIPKFLASANVCLLPSYNNDVMRNIVPIKMYEYLASGRPIISSRLPGIVNEFGNSSGVLYIDRPEEAVALSFELSKNQSLVSSLSSQAVGFVAKRSWDVLTDNFEVLLEGLISQTGTNAKLTSEIWT